MEAVASGSAGNSSEPTVRNETATRFMALFPSSSPESGGRVKRRGPRAQPAPESGGRVKRRGPRAQPARTEKYLVKHAREALASITTEDCCSTGTDGGRAFRERSGPWHQDSPQAFAALQVEGSPGPRPGHWSSHAFSNGHHRAPFEPSSSNGLFAPLPPEDPPILAASGAVLPSPREPARAMRDASGTTPHELGQCSPCMFFASANGCTRGQDCQYCHELRPHGREVTVGRSPIRASAGASGGSKNSSWNRNLSLFTTLMGARLPPGAPVRRAGGPGASSSSHAHGPATAAPAAATTPGDGDAFVHAGGAWPLQPGPVGILAEGSRSAPGAAESSGSFPRAAAREPNASGLNASGGHRHGFQV